MVEKWEDHPLLEVSMERKLAAILSADVKGYSRLMGEDEEATIRTLTAYRAIMTTHIQQHRGRVVDSPGDNLLAEFASVVDALHCAVEIQRDLQTKNAALPDHRKMEFRIGINLGDVVVEGERLYGDGVNIAARLESLAEPGGICISGTIYEHVENKVPLTYEYLGEQTVKNITKPVRVYRVAMDEAAEAVARQAALRQTQHEREPDEGRTGLKPTPTASPGKQKRGVGTARLPRTAALAALGVLLLVGIIASVQYLSVRLPAPSATISPQQPSVLPLPDKPSIIVLPFVNMSKDPEQEYFSDGLTEDLITNLSKFSGLFIIARNSAFTYKGKAVKVQDVSREMGVRYVLEGSVRKAEDRVRINTQLVDATTGHHLWSERYDRELKHIFALQDEIIQQIVGNLNVEVWQAEMERVRRIHTENLTAYDYHLRGTELFQRGTKEANLQARQMFEKAVALDPQYAEAYTSVGLAHYSDWFFLWTTDLAQSLEQAFEMAQRAIALNNSLYRPHQLLGTLYVWKKQHEQAIAEAELAIALNPNDALGYVTLANILAFAGQPEEAIRLVEKAMRLNPRYPGFYLSSLGFAYRVAGRYKEAITPLKRVLALHPNYVPAHFGLAICYAELGQQEEAQAEVAEVLRLNPNYSLGVWSQRLPFKDPAVLERQIAALRKAGLK